MDKSKRQIGIVAGWLFFQTVCGCLLWGDTVYFEQGGEEATWTGQLRGMKEGILYWENPDIAEPAQLTIEAVRAVGLGEEGKEKLGSYFRKYPTVVMTNGDGLVGEIVSIEEEKIKLKLAGEIEMDVDRALVDRVRQDNVLGKCLYTGPQSREDWGIVEGAKGVSTLVGWRYEKGSLFFEDQAGGAWQGRISPQLLGARSFANKDNALVISKEILPSGSFILVADIYQPQGFQLPFRRLPKVIFWILGVSFA